VRVRVCVKLALFCALSVCAMQNIFYWAYGTNSSLSPVSEARVVVREIQEKPTLFCSPISTDHLPLLCPRECGDALRFSNLIVNSSSVGDVCDQADEEQTIDVATKAEREIFLASLRAT